MHREPGQTGAAAAEGLGEQSWALGMAQVLEQTLQAQEPLGQAQAESCNPYFSQEILSIFIDSTIIERHMPLNDFFGPGIFSSQLILFILNQYVLIYLNNV